MLKKSNFNSIFKSSIIVGNTGLLAGLWFKASDGEDEPNLVANMKYTGPQSSSCCPLLTSWDGEKYVLEAEAIGIA